MLAQGSPGSAAHVAGGSNCSLDCVVAVTCPSGAKIALLIGNEAYGNEIGRLANPHNDVALLEQALKGLAFEVITVHDAGLGALTRAVNAFARRLQAAGPKAVGFFYYCGHVDHTTINFRNGVSILRLHMVSMASASSLIYSE
jgi:hypothetical protein